MRKNVILETSLTQKFGRPVFINWFTLVELIVVITILAILGTIAIIAFSWYSRNARDSARLSDIGNMKKSLELWILQSWSYPEPTNWTGVTYSWSTVWNQWTFWESVFQTVGKLDKKPIDPKYDMEYTYSITQSKKEYQIGAVLEKDMALIDSNTGLSNWLVLSSIIPQAHASSTQWEAYVTGNYNGVLTTIGGSPTYIIALPSIMLSNLITTELKSVSPNLFVYKWKATLPASYANVWLTMTWSDFSFTPIVVWSGSTIAELNSQLEFQNLVENLQTVYKNNTAFASLPEYASIVWTNDVSSEVMNFAKTLIEISTSQELKNVSTIPLWISWVCGSEDNQVLWNSSSITGTWACTEWTLSGLTGVGPWSWECVWTYGRWDASCSAQKVVCNDWETVQNGQCKDPYWSLVSSLLYFDSDIIDQKTKTWTITAWASTSWIAKNWSNSLSLPTSNYITTPFTADHNLWTWPFTIEAWINRTSTSANQTIFARSSGTYGITRETSLYITSSTNIAFYYWIRGTNQTVLNFTVPEMNLNAWYHIALVREANNSLKLYINGVVSTSVNSLNVDINGNLPSYIWSFYAWSIYYPFYWYIDDFRITKWVARYSSDFTPPPQAYPNQ